MYNKIYTFEWSEERELENILRHKISFAEALEVFTDARVLHLEDVIHSSREDRFYAVGKTKNGDVITVRYTVRDQTIRIFGAAKWRKWRKYYEKENSGSKQDETGKGSKTDQ